MPPVHIRVSGAWKEVDKVHIKVGGVWKQVDQASIRTGGAWRETIAVGPTVSARADGRFNSSIIGPVYSGCQFSSSGSEYEYTIQGALTNVTTWLDSGAAGDVWVERIITGGSFNSLDPGAGRHQLSTTRSFRVIRSATGTHTCACYFRFWDAASGGNLLQQTSGALWSAEYDFDPCPLCCFTPDTPVTMASGVQLPIDKVRKGDMILVWDAVQEKCVPQECTGIITRTNRAMFRMRFEDGRYLDASDDHPFHVKGKGPASINPQVEYKDLGIPDTLEVGDMVTDQSRLSRKIVGIEPITYPGTVYTFENSLFYANGLLVY